MLPHEYSNDRVMAVGEDVGVDFHLLAEDALDRIAAAVDLGPDRFDHDPRRRLTGVILA
jgi:hypothetical protein